MARWTAEQRDEVAARGWCPRSKRPWDGVSSQVTAIERPDDFVDMDRRGTVTYSGKRKNYARHITVIPADVTVIDRCNFAQLLPLTPAVILEGPTVTFTNCNLINVRLPAGAVVGEFCNTAQVYYTEDEQVDPETGEPVIVAGVQPVATRWEDVPPGTTPPANVQAPRQQRPLSVETILAGYGASPTAVAKSLIDFKLSGVDQAARASMVRDVVRRNIRKIRARFGFSFSEAEAFLLGKFGGA